VKHSGSPQPVTRENVRTVCALDLTESRRRLSALDLAESRRRLGAPDLPESSVASSLPI
jgi:hypothetical protein